MRWLLPLLALSALAPGQAEVSQVRHGFFPEIRKGVAPDERRALIIGKALWVAAAGADSQNMTSLSVRRVGDVWLLSATTPEIQRGKDSVLDGTCFMAFDSSDGGFLVATVINPPSDENLLKILRRKRAEIRQGMK